MQTEDELSASRTEPRLPESAVFHELFNSPDGDVILGAHPHVSLQGDPPVPEPQVFFRIHSFTLKMTCGFFRSMYSLPQKQSSANKAPPEILYLAEDAITLEHLLRMICGLPLLPLTSPELVDTLLDAIEKYDCPGPMSIIRLICTTSQVSAHPLWLYAVSCRFGWDAEARMASTQSLKYNLHLPELRPLLQRLSTTSVLDLFELHRSRREGLRNRLNQAPFVSGGDAVPCGACNQPVNYYTWRELKYKIILEMDERPLGDIILNHGLHQWPEATACWSANCQCNRPLYDQEETMRVIRECIDSLPSEIP